MSISTHTGTVRHVRRLRNSLSGNPRWELTFVDGTVLSTGGDSQHGYGVTPALVGRFVTVGYDRSGIHSIVVPS